MDTLPMTAVLTRLVGLADRSLVDLCERDLTDELRISKLAFDLTRQAVRKQRIQVLLSCIQPIHQITRTLSKAKLQRRIRQCVVHRYEIISRGIASDDFLRNHLPSRNRITIVAAHGRTYYAVDGNSRLAALKAVFLNCDHLLVEVDELILRTPNEILSRLDDYRRFRGIS